MCFRTSTTLRLNTQGSPILVVSPDIYEPDFEARAANINAVGLGMFVSRKAQLDFACVDYFQVGIAVMVKYNDKTVMRLKEKRGGKFERTSPSLRLLLS